MSNFKNELRGCGPFLHDDPVDRPTALFAGRTTLMSSQESPAYLLLPIVPALTLKRSGGAGAGDQSGT
jgi:hypothetical protein